MGFLKVLAVIIFVIGGMVFAGSYLSGNRTEYRCAGATGRMGSIEMTFNAYFDWFKMWSPSDGSIRVVDAGGKKHVYDILEIQGNKVNIQQRSGVIKIDAGTLLMNTGRIDLEVGDIRFKGVCRQVS